MLPINVSDVQQVDFFAFSNTHLFDITGTVNVSIDILDFLEVLLFQLFWETVHVKLVSVCIFVISVLGGVA